jgi:hypothetical protein
VREVHEPVDEYPLPIVGLSQAVHPTNLHMRCPRRQVPVLHVRDPQPTSSPPGYRSAA